MNTTTTLTERDKKLLSVMSVLLIAAGFGIFIIRPLHKASDYMKQQISENEAKVTEVLNKVQTLDMVRVTNENEKAKLGIAQQEVYPMMRSKDIDRIFSEVVEANGLSTRKLQISMPEESVSMIPFLAVQDTEGSNPDGLDALYVAKVTLEVTGSSNGLDMLVDAVSKNKSGIRIEKLTWSEGRGASDPETGVTPVEEVLKLEMSVYMSNGRKE